MSTINHFETEENASTDKQLVREKRLEKLLEHLQYLQEKAKQNKEVS